ncbi:permease [uncultured Desulfobacter sp.]|uniref:permease n=1 Tax=uncultured Desulfobacter sp. TaxID=240139 RepID=UPI0029F521F9|nr:permease [uncultured Desulfobacter sp.]
MEKKGGYEFKYNPDRYSPEKNRAFLSGKSEFAGNIFAALLGIVTPFCSCSAVPLFIGFVTAGVPLGVTFSFLISAPMVNEIALGLLYGLLGWKVAAIYLGTGLFIAISAVKEIIGRVWIYVILGIAVGAGIHGFVPEGMMASIMGKGSWWSVPASVLIGVPLYSNAAGVIPVVEALLGKGAALGSVLAFMMSVIALSLPEMVILRKVLKPRLIGVFVGVVACGILIVGYLFNTIL